VLKIKIVLSFKLPVEQIAMCKSCQVALWKQ